MPQTPQTRRIDRGAGHSYLLDGEPPDSVTKILSEGVPKPALIDAAARETANYAVNNWDDLAREGLAQRLRKIEKGRFDAWRGATRRGTVIHSYAAALLAGQTVDVPDPYVDHVDQCLAFMRDWQVVDVAVEATIVNRQWRYMGTVDLIARLGEDAEPSDFWLFDWKTGASGVWPETALQLAAYAHAEIMLVAGPDGTPDGAEVTFPRVARAAAVHIRADGFDVIPVDISDATFRTFRYVQQVALFSGAGREAYVSSPITSPFE